MDTLTRIMVESAAQLNTELLNEGLLTSGLSHAMHSFSRKIKPTYPPLSSAPCANVTPKPCETPGTKECQSTHWKAHKRVCKDPLLSPRWKPIWEARDYKPSFSPDDEVARDKFRLWGSTPPVDIVNLEMNENDAKKDLTIAFVESGDLQNVVKTINSLPEDYSGKAEILINDPEGSAAFRNLALLLLLGDYPVDDLAVEAALHGWVSVVMPLAYAAMHSTCFFSLRKSEGPMRLAFGSVSSSVGLGLSGGVSSGEKEWFPKYGHTRTQFTASGNLDGWEALAYRSIAYESTVTADDRDRVYAQVAPAHRVALKKYQDDGIVLPFGVTRDQMTAANISLFSPSKTWVPTNGANPLHGWDLNEVVAKGAAYGAQPEDIYGCPYFYLTDQLREFRRRIRNKFSISFHVTSLPANELSAAIARHRPTIRFDRVDLGSTLDHDKVGIKNAIQSWAPLLSKQMDAAITGYCKTWVDIQPDGKVKGAGDERFREAVRNIVTNMKTVKPINKVLSEMGDSERLSFSVCHNIEMGYDNSKAFAAYLAMQCLDEALSDTGLKLRSARRIVPHRIGVPLQAPSSALPELENEEAWYRATMMNTFSWSERYLEFGRE